MLILGLDTSGALVSAAVHSDDRALAVCSLASPRGHAEALAPLIAAALSEAGAQVDDLTGVAVGVGPGPFTGLRVGLATAAVFGLARRLPVYGVCSLDALADAAVQAEEVTEGEFLIATDARRREVYWARYVVHRGETGPEAAGPEAAGLGTAGSALTGPWAERLDGPQVSAPAEALNLNLAIIGRLIAGIERDVTAADVARVAVRALKDPSRAAAARLIGTEPLYLRRPDATEPGARKRVLT